MRLPNFCTNNRGVALVGILVCLLTIGAITTLLWQSIVRGYRLKYLSLKAQDTYHNASTTLTNLIIGAQQQPSPSSSNAILSIKNDVSSIAVLTAENITETVNTTLTRAINRANNYGLRYPDWSYLKQRLPNAQSICQTWATNASAIGPIYHERICLRISQVNQSAILSADLKASEPITISAVGTKRLTLAILGDVELAHSLIVKNSHDAEIEILALGKLLVSQIKLESSSGVSLLLHASNGKSQLQSWPENIPLCGSSIFPVQVSVESPYEAIVGSFDETKPAVLGCPFVKSAPYWPSISIIGGEVANTVKLTANFS